MFTWLMTNLATILVALGVAGLVAWIVCRMVKNRRAGKSSCGGNCGHCPMGCACHAPKETEESKQNP